VENVVFIFGIYSFFQGPFNELHISVAFGGPFESKKKTAHCSFWKGSLWNQSTCLRPAL